MYHYHLTFETPASAESFTGAPEDADIESDHVYAVGDIVEHEGRRWVVTHAPVEDPMWGASADLLLWPA